VTQFQTIRYDVDDGIGRITLARPDKRNAVNREMFAELGEATANAADDPAVLAVILGGEGPTFCAGLDLSAVGDLAGLRGGQFRAFARLAQRPYLNLARMPKPAIAAVQGHAVGAGFQLALACDLRVLAEDARVGMLEARYGLIPDLSGIHHLARLVGPALAKELVWTTRLVEADETERIGLANRVVPIETLAKAAQDLAAEVTTYSPTAIALSKGLFGRVFETSLEHELEREAESQALALGSDDHQESVAAFLEKRPPKFR
jgi:enoyl-CoA hydratase/carnithine racemase